MDGGISEAALMAMLPEALGGTAAASVPLTAAEIGSQGALGSALAGGGGNALGILGAEYGAPALKGLGAASRGLGMANTGMGLLGGGQQQQMPPAPVMRPPQMPITSAQQILGAGNGSAAMVGNRMGPGAGGIDPQLFALLMQQLRGGR